MRELSNKEKRELSGVLSVPVGKKDSVVYKDGVYFLNKEPFLVEVEETVFPHLKYVNKIGNPLAEGFGEVFIDKGALSFILKGANLMKPGVSSCDNVKEGGKVLVKDDTHGKAVAVGFALCDEKDLEDSGKGKCVRVLHYYNDGFFRV